MKRCSFSTGVHGCLLLDFRGSSFQQRPTVALHTTDAGPRCHWLPSAVARRLEASAIGQFSQKALPTLSWHHGTWEPVSSQHDTHTIHTHLEHSPPPQGADLFFKGHSSLLNNSMAVFLLSGQTCFPVFTSRVVGGSSTIFCRHSCTQSAEIHALFRVLPKLKCK